ncbi:MAG: dTDP-4-dehydrorhamnose 3,5-epimerase [Lachnospiraceae bacterium]|nr:dTDP-4-dehydrorhamnose 3,5-epimerase [Lachnospiraceae bacterium]
MIQINETKFKDVYKIEPKYFEDARGWFTDTWSVRDYRNKGINYNFVQDSKSFSEKKYTLRGLHFQLEPMEQAKLITCVKGAIRDAIVDLREDSPTYLQWMMLEITEESRIQLLIPRGFAHGFLTLEDKTEVHYKLDNEYAPQQQRTLLWKDTDVGIDWKIEEKKIILSEKDRNGLTIKELFR